MGPHPGRYRLFHRRHHPGRVRLAWRGAGLAGHGPSSTRASRSLRPVVVRRSTHPEPPTRPAPPKLVRDVEGTRPKRYLVLGSEGHGRGVRAHRWDKVPAGLNVADYDVVMLNFVAFEDEALAEGFPIERLPAREQFARLLFSAGSTIIAIGDPRTRVGARDSEGIFDSRLRVDYWLPCFIGVEDDSGSSYRVRSEEWGPYFDQLRAWSWIATGEFRPHEPADYLGAVTGEANHLAMGAVALATTRYEKEIALQLRFQALRVTRVPSSWGIYDDGATEQALIRESSPLFWLPKPDQVTVEEAIDLILRERYGIAEVACSPDWISDYSLPDEAPIAEQIATLENERRAVEAQIAEARERTQSARRPKLLLYEKGQDVLEPIVRETLRTLGATVKEPEAGGIEDGTLEHRGRFAVIEIKGRNGPLKVDDVRQVVQWAADAKGRDGIEYKPFIFGNPHCNTAPPNRAEPLAPKAIAYAENSGVGVVTTARLFEALRQHQIGEFDEATFWDTVFEATGLAQL